MKIFARICVLSAAAASTLLPVLASESEKYKVVTTVGMITDIVSVVAGERAKVNGLIGEGIDPHLYKPTRNDVVALNNADVIFYNGLMLEGKMADTLIRMARKGKPIYAVTDTILTEGAYVITQEDEHYDPHVWMDVQGWIKAVEMVAQALGEYDQKSSDYYTSRAEAYIEKLKELDHYAKESIASIPETQRVLVTAHDAFNYLGRAYGIEVLGIQGLSTESEAGVRKIEDLIDFIVEKKIPAVFVESSVSDKNVRALIEGAKASGHLLKIGGELFSDAMGPANTYEGTYIGMIDHNISTITTALGGIISARSFESDLEKEE